MAPGIKEKLWSGEFLSDGFTSQLLLREGLIDTVLKHLIFLCQPRSDTVINRSCLIASFQLNVWPRRQYNKQ